MPLLCALGSFRAGAAAVCRCSGSLGAGGAQGAAALMPLQGAAVCACFWDRVPVSGGPYDLFRSVVRRE